MYHCLTCLCSQTTNLAMLYVCAQFADETHHRDVNHTFAEMDQQDPNPFVLQHKLDALRAHALYMSGETAWPAQEPLTKKIKDAAPKAQV